MNPLAETYGEGTSPLAPRVPTLSGLRVGLLWNGKARGDVALMTIAQALEDQFPDVKCQLYTGSIKCDRELLDMVADECDVAIGCTADCGSCTSWMTHDCIVLEKQGVPSVVVASAGFEHDVEASARAFALPGLRYVVVPKVYNNLSDDLARSQTIPIVDEVVASLTASERAPLAATPEDDRPAFDTLIPASPEIAAAHKRFQEQMIALNISDGYPLHIPTTDDVKAMVEQVGGDPDDLVCIVPPGNGHATLGKVAVNAAMAGATPAELPVIIACLKALVDAPMDPRGALMSTSAQAPFFVVNGPIATEIGLNGGRSCLGPGPQNEVNLRIGRAVLLCLRNLGAWTPGVMDLDCIGTPRKHIAVIAENEAESPWEPYHVSQGFGPEGNAVTLFFSSGEWDIAIQGHTDGRQLATAIGAYSGGLNGRGYFDNLAQHRLGSGLGRLLLLAPPHAQPIAEAGFTKQGLERYLYQLGQEPVARFVEPLRKLHQDGKIRAEWEWLFELSPEEAGRRTLPVVEEPGDYRVVVAGSVRAKDLLLPIRITPHTVTI